MFFIFLEIVSKFDIGKQLSDRHEKASGVEKRDEFCVFLGKFQVGKLERKFSDHRIRSLEPQPSFIHA